MKKLLLLSLFIVGLGFALFNFKGLANQGTFESIVLDFRDDLSLVDLKQQINAISSEYGVVPRLNSQFSVDDHFYVVNGDRELLKTLKKSEVSQYTEYIEPAYEYQTLDIPNDPFYAQQWNLRSINVEKAWSDSKGSGITVAVIDTGVSRVPDLKNTKFVKGYDFVNNRELADDDNGHGTHVAGTIAQTTNNGYGVAGIAYEASIMPLKVLSASGGGNVADIAEAIRFAADNGADVINMSLGGAGESNAMKEAIAYAHNKGVVIVAAAGNEQRNSASHPARYVNVIGVAAIDSTGQKAPYSNFGAGVDISAPGGDTTNGDEGGILQETISFDPDTNLPGFAFQAYQGTSMAAPHVAGVAALIKASGVTDPEKITAILKESARDVEEDPLNHFGAGHLDAASAVALAKGGQFDFGLFFGDFFRWLRDNGYLNPRFWIDGGVYALLPKVLMVVGSYLIAWLLKMYFPFSWTMSMATGLVAGSSGLFVFRGFYIFDLPQWPFRVLGSSIPELGTAISGSSAFNPLFASVIIPVGLILLLLGHPQWKWFAIGSTIGVATCLGISAVLAPAPTLLWIGSGIGARAFLLVNAFLCLGLASLAMKDEGQIA